MAASVAEHLNVGEAISVTGISDHRVDETRGQRVRHANTERQSGRGAHLVRLETENEGTLETATPSSARRQDERDLNGVEIGNGRTRNTPICGMSPASCRRHGAGTENILVTRSTPDGMVG
jgi:cobyric acid synthase